MRRTDLWIGALSLVIALAGCSNNTGSSQEAASASPGSGATPASAPAGGSAANGMDSQDAGGNSAPGSDDSAEGAVDPGTQDSKDAPADNAATENDPVAAAKAFIAEHNLDLAEGTSKQKLPKPPKFTFDPDTKYFWVIETNVGTLKIRLWPDVAPMHVSSTIYLATLGFYDGIRFHRVIPNFMAQGGCPIGTGTGGPGYKYAGEFDPKIKHDRPGLLSMANAGPNTDGSQFFLTFVPTPHLNGKHTLFGEVVEGMDTLKELEKFGSGGGATSKALMMEKTTIVTE